MAETVFEATLDGHTRRHLRKFTELEYEINTAHERGTVYQKTVPIDVPAYGLLAGDIISIEAAYYYIEGKIGVWHINDRKEDGLFFAQAESCFGDVLLIFAKGEPVRHNPKNVSFLGHLVSFERKIQITTNERQKKSEPDNSEITVTCDDCGTSMTGTKTFLTGMAWKIRSNYTYCVSCR